MPRQSSRTPLFSALRSAVREAHNLNRDPRFHERREISRREMLKLMGVSSLALGAASLLPACRSSGRTMKAKSDLRIAIVGAGLAGLNAAHHLRKSGIRAQIFEASSRAGGRCHSAADLLAPGLVTELGGEFLDSTHTDMLALAHEFELEVYDCKGPSETHLIEAYSFGERLYSNAQVLEEFRPLAALLAKDAEVAAAWTDVPSPQVVALDRLSLTEYLERLQVRGWLKDLITVAYVSEYGIEADEQSALNLITLISTDLSTNYFDLYGASDERYKIRGGNQGVPNALAKRLQDQIHYGQKLEAISEISDGYRLTFQDSGAVREVDTDAVILAVPFTVLRSVALPHTFPAEKLNVIQELGYGTNSKTMAGFNSRPWRDLGYSGSFFSGTQYQSGWDNSRAQPGTRGGITIYLGGKLGAECNRYEVEAYMKKALPWVGRLFANCDREFNGKLSRFHWASNPYALGSYSVYKTGQWTTLSGHESTPVGNIFFAGEHCSENFQGFMNGAAESGRLAAVSLVARLRGTEAPGTAA